MIFTRITYTYIVCLFQSDAGWEEYYDYIFPDEVSAQPNLKLLAMAKKWKQAQETDSASTSSTNIDLDEDWTV